MKDLQLTLSDSATNNDCKIFSYDINFNNKIFNSKKAKYINSDITNNYLQLIIKNCCFMG